MKFRFITLLAIVAMMATGNSCTNNEEELASVEDSFSLPATRTITEETDTFTVHAIYKDVKYSTVAVSKGDSLFYLNDKFNELMETIGNIPGSVSFVRNDSCTEYFDSQEEFLTKYGIRELSEQEKADLET